MSRSISRAGLLAVVASLSVGVGVAPAVAKTSKPEKRQNTLIKRNTSANKKNTSANKRQDSSLRKIKTAAKLAGLAIARAQSTANTANGKADSILAQAPAIIDALTKLKDGLTAIQTALKDPVTGLVGLNNARPKFAVITTDTKQSPPASSVAGATPGFVGVTRRGAGVYVLNFGQDVSKRAPQVSINTPGPQVGGASGIGQIFNCGASDAARAGCEQVLPGSGNANNALVTTEAVVSGAGQPADLTFTATEIAG